MPDGAQTATEETSFWGCRLKSGRRDTISRRGASPSATVSLLADEPVQSSFSPLLLSLPFELSPSSVALFSVVASVALWASLSSASYFQLEYVIAALLARNISKGGATIVDMKVGSGKGLFYLPSDAEKVFALNTEGRDAQLAKNQAISAGVFLDICPGGPLKGWSGIPTSSVDAVVTSKSLASLPSEQLPLVLKEAARVLKPNKPIIFVEKVEAEGGGLAVLAQSVGNVFKGGNGGRSRVEASELLTLLSQGLFGQVQYDRVGEWLDPHVVGVALRSREPFPSAFSSPSSSSTSAFTAPPTSRSTAVGFREKDKKRSKRA